MEWLEDLRCRGGRGSCADMQYREGGPVAGVRRWCHGPHLCGVFLQPVASASTSPAFYYTCTLLPPSKAMDAACAA